jgi:phage gpG-like protein
MATVIDVGSGLTHDDMVEIVRRIKFAFVGMTKANINAGRSPDGSPFAPLKWPRPSGGKGLPLRDKGLFAASITSSGALNNIDESLAGGLGFRWGTNHVAAAIHQHGGTITASKAKWLTIPLTREAARGGARSFGENLKFLLRGRGGIAYTVREGKGKRAGKQTKTIQFVLVKSVDVPARKFLGSSEEFIREAKDIAIDYVRMLASRRSGQQQRRGAAG